MSKYLKDPLDKRKTPYELFGVSPAVSFDEIEEAYGKKLETPYASI